MAFQISDDIIDIASDDSGKTPGTDLREGVRTLPVLYTLADPAADPRLRELVSGPITAEHEVIRGRRPAALLRRAGHRQGHPGRLRRRRGGGAGAAAGITVAGRPRLAGRFRGGPHPVGQWLRRAVPVSARTVAGMISARSVDPRDTTHGWSGRPTG